MWHKVFLISLTIFIEFTSAHLLPGIYCGEENCYDILNVTRDSTKNEISKNYRHLARIYHPDMRETGDEEIFKKIANAYEILKDEDARKDYDYMLEHPEAYYQNYYRYYRRKGPKVDIRLVIFSTISVISFVQYFVKRSRYNEAVDYFVSVQKYRNKALEIIASDKSLQDVLKEGKKSKMSKTEIKELQEKQIRQVIEENMDIKGAYEKPNVFDILWIQIIIFPYTLAKYIAWNVSWIYKFTIMQKPYGEEEKLHLIRKHLGMGKHQFNAIEEDTISDYLRKELWKKEKFKEWKKAQEEEMKAKMAESNRYKSYRRYMKNNKNRITFDD
ncbi:dnaJ homolog subfamily C member 25 homolog [Chironomus tepperi]|uniref:dnaJ homolog subfamily C member 25 homolog n=1 Tax=Chironomus tepperi TaxID=113505 RepID=UPI00391F8663